MDRTEIISQAQNVFQGPLDHILRDFDQNQQKSIKRPAGHHHPLTSHLTFLVSHLTSSGAKLFICKMRINMDVVERVLDWD